MSAPHVRVRLDLTPVCSIGPGKVALLEAIEKTGSISAAARAIGMSYRRAWVLVDELNSSFNAPITQSSVGGAGGGGVGMTDLGRELVASYRRLELQVDGLAAKHLEGIASHARQARPGARPKPGARKPLNRR